VLSSEEGAPPLAAAGKAVELRRHHFFLERDGVEMLVATEPVRHDGRTWFVQFASSTRLSAVLREYIGVPLLGRSVVVYGLVALLVYGAVMHYTLRIILKPLNDASAMAARISPRTLSARLRMDGLPVSCVLWPRASMPRLIASSTAIVCSRSFWLPPRMN
jgi:two-component system, OmpR family, sensor histidine kinase QseC